MSILSVAPTNGTATSGTNVVFTPTLNFHGTATIGYTIIDGIGGTNTSLITVLVTDLTSCRLANPRYLLHHREQHDQHAWSPLGERHLEYARRHLEHPLGRADQW